MYSFHVVTPPRLIPQPLVCKPQTEEIPPPSSFLVCIKSAHPSALKSYPTPDTVKTDN